MTNGISHFFHTCPKSADLGLITGNGILPGTAGIQRYGNLFNPPIRRDIFVQTAGVLQQVGIIGVVPQRSADQLSGCAGQVVVYVSAESKRANNPAGEGNMGG